MERQRRMRLVIRLIVGPEVHFGVVAFGIEFRAFVEEAVG